MNLPKTDYTNKKIGTIKVLQYGGNGKWMCHCDCGADVIVRTPRIRNGTHLNCPLKKKSSFDTLKPYVYECLSEYGNTAISEKTYRKCGKKRILEELKLHGYDCSIKLRNINNAKTVWSETKEVYVIITVNE